VLRRAEAAEVSALDRMARDEAILDMLRERAVRAAATGKLAPAQVARLYIAMFRILARRRENLLPAIAEARDARALVSAVMETAVEKLGEARAKKFLASVRERFDRKVASGGGCRRESVKQAGCRRSAVAAAGCASTAGAPMGHSAEGGLPEGRGEEGTAAPAGKAGSGEGASALAARGEIAAVERSGAGVGHTESAA
jgi:hypothetical protein